MKKASVFLITGILFLASCAAPARTDEARQIYYVSAEGNRLSSVSFDPESTDEKTLAEDLFTQLQRDDWIPEGGVSVVPAGITLHKLRLVKDVVCIDLTGDYASLRQDQKILLLSGIVYTFAQVEDTAGVRLTINNQPLLNSAEEEIGLLTKDDFVENDSNDINTYLSQEMTLFFTDDLGIKLVPEVRTVYFSGNELLQQVILEELIRGPESPELKGILPSDLSFISVSVQDDVCYVNFDSEFTNAVFGADYEKVFYSIVNSIAFNSDINKVRFSVNGAESMVLDGFDLSGTFSPDFSLSF